jgi:hypothetical protein
MREAASVLFKLCRLQMHSNPVCMACKAACLSDAWQSTHTSDCKLPNTKRRTPAVSCVPCITQALNVDGCCCVTPFHPPQVPVVITEQERVTGVTQQASEHVSRTDVTEQERASTGVTEARGEQVCGQKTFTEVEDRPVVRERVERIVEHRPVEKQVRCQQAEVHMQPPHCAVLVPSWTGVCQWQGPYVIGMTVIR